MAGEFLTISQLREVARRAEAAIAEEFRENGWRDEPPSVSPGLAGAVLKAAAEIVAEEG